MFFTEITAKKLHKMADKNTAVGCVTTKTAKINTTVLLSSMSPCCQCEHDTMRSVFLRVLKS